ncbi:MAG: prolipoprotein diacylglyceryl transferase [Lachnospiraceae bacterium]|nr:prolipoprotein diacylglyceryl transferase [Lachnospiraceae bacterium]
MYDMIYFPNLGIHLDNVGRGFTVFGFHVAFYGLIVGIAILLGFVLGFRDAKITGQKQDDYMNMGIIGVVAGIAGARLYYVIFSWDFYRGQLLQIFNLRAGGLAILGGVIGAFSTVLIYSRVKKLNTLQMCDTVAICMVNGQMLGRWGNFLNREAFGGYTNNLFAMQLPVRAVRYGDISAEMQAHIQVIDGIDFIQVHPTFLYESALCAVILALLILLRKRKQYHGQLFLLYLLLYGVGRFFIEGLRTDQLLLPMIHLPVSQVLAAAMAIISIVLLIVLNFKQKSMRKL